MRLAWSQYETSYLCYESRIASVPPPRNHILCFNTATVYVCILCKSFEFKVVLLKYSSGLYIPSIMQQFFCIKFHNKKNKNKVKKKKSNGNNPCRKLSLYGTLKLATLILALQLLLKQQFQINHLIWQKILKWTNFVEKLFYFL